MVGTIEYMGVKFLPLISGEDNCVYVSIRWNDDTGGYCRGRTFGELKAQIRAVMDFREKEGKSLILKKGQSCIAPLPLGLDC